MRPSNKLCRSRAALVTKTVPVNNNNKIENILTKCFITCPKNLPASSGKCAPLFLIEIIPVK